MSGLLAHGGWAGALLEVGLAVLVLGVGAVALLRTRGRDDEAEDE